MRFLRALGRGVCLGLALLIAAQLVAEGPAAGPVALTKPSAVNFCTLRRPHLCEGELPAR